MPRIGFGMFVVLIMCCANVSGSDQALDTLGLYPIEEKLIQQTNRERVRHGLAPLTLSLDLIGTARKHTAWMCQTGNFVHNDDQVPENIALGQESAAGALQAWMNSSGHRANILNPSYTRIGVAAYQVDDDGMIYWCQQFLQ